MLAQNLIPKNKFFLLIFASFFLVACSSVPDISGDTSLLVSDSDIEYPLVPEKYKMFLNSDDNESVITSSLIIKEHFYTSALGDDCIKLAVTDSSMKNSAKERFIVCKRHVNWFVMPDVLNQKNGSLK